MTRKSVVPAASGAAIWFWFNSAQRSVGGLSSLYISLRERKVGGRE